MVHEPPEPSGSTVLRSAVPALPVSNERRAVAFYVGALGFRELMHDGEGLAILIRDAVELHLWVADGGAPGAEAHLAGSASCRIEVTGIDALHQRCSEEAIVHPNAGLQDRPWGMREFGILDPDGNLLTFFQHQHQPPSGV